MMDDLYHYEESGLDYIYLLGGVEFSEYDGEEYIEIKNADELDIAIGRYILKSGRPFTGREFKFFRSSLGYGRQEFAELFNADYDHIEMVENSIIVPPKELISQLKIMFLDDLRGFTNQLDITRAIFPEISEKIKKQFHNILGENIKLKSLHDVTTDQHIKLYDLTNVMQEDALESRILKIIEEDIEDFESVGEDRTNSKFFFPINHGHWEKPLAIAA